MKGNWLGRPTVTVLEVAFSGLVSLSWTKKNLKRKANKKTNKQKPKTTNKLLPDVESALKQ